MKILVACGGVSPEREVSLNSGAAVENALKGAGYQTVKIDVTSIGDVAAAYESNTADIVFIALHGGWGEDGRLQAVLDSQNIPYTGAGSEACMIAMDKAVSLALLREKYISIPKSIVLKKAEDAITEKVTAFLARYEKIVIKPSKGGSTVGVSIIDDDDQISDAIKESLLYDDVMIVERYIDGRELTVTVLEKEGEIFALPIIEILPACGFYDYNSKYTYGATEYLCPAPLSDIVSAQVKDLSVKAHRTLRCSVYSRVDLRLGRRRPYVLEVNTAPGMTSTSLVPKAAAAFGMTFAQLLTAIIKESLSRRQKI